MKPRCYGREQGAEQETKPVRQAKIDVIGSWRQRLSTMASELTADMASELTADVESESEMDRPWPESSAGQWSRVLPWHVRRQHGRD
jgi:predicted secreted protein